MYVVCVFLRNILCSAFKSLLQTLHNRFMLSDNITTDRHASECNAKFAKLVLRWIPDNKFIVNFTFNAVCYLCVLTV